VNLSVVILNWNAAEDTAYCIRSVLAWEIPAPKCATTIWVVDNASHPPGIGALKSEFTDVRFLMSPVNRGFAGGCNLGIEAALDAGSDVVLLLNNDATVNGSSVSSMLETLQSDPSIGIVGPSLWDGDDLLSVGGRDIARFGATHVKPARPPERLLEVDYVSGTVALIASEAVDEVGLLDEDYFFAGEMADFCLRAKRRGYLSVTDPRAKANHDLARSSEFRDTLHNYYIYRNRFLYVKKHYPERRLRLYALWTLRGAYAVLKALASANLPRAKAIRLGVCDGWSGHFGGRNDRVLT
jgi:GT2 family glycosyltransferase